MNNNDKPVAQPERLAATTNVPGRPGFVERRRREKGRGRRLAIYLGLTALLSIVLGRFWGITSVATNLLQSVAPKQTANEVEAPHEVLTIEPTAGGLPRKIVQTGTIEPIESADLHVRISGYIKTVSFDIGDAVNEGDVVAEIDADELLKDVEKQAALVELAESRVVQSLSRVKTSIAKCDAARGSIQKAVAEIERAEAAVALHEKELSRIRNLAEQQAIETKLADEKEFELLAAKAELSNAHAAESVAKAELVSLQANIEQAKSDVTAVRAEVRVAKADLDRSQVMANYMKVVSPFTGVVTARNYDRGDYVNASGSHRMPLLTIARNDRMRAVIQIPAPDVPYVHPGQRANVSVNSLGGRVIDGIISRVARTQDLRTRTMRVEVDLDNKDRELAGGMYGAVSVEVPAPTNELSIPKSCLIGRALNGRGRVYVFDGSRLVMQKIGVGRQYGDRIEVLEGLSLENQIVSSKTRDFGSLHNGQMAILEPPTTSLMADAKPKETAKKTPSKALLAKPAVIGN